ncbi:MAG: hypothetical protein J3R72DRAFT_427848 [Linnemannia gamsii]|nr:MAG: hypothetical protein J3R72DRAFT_427848 [Linnemannia gamsii]
MVIPAVESRPTQAQYMKHVRQWLTFCENNYGGDAAVTPARVLGYMDKEVFTGGTFKRIHPGAAFNGAVARWRKEVLDTNLDLGSAKKRRKKSQKKAVEALDGEDGDSELDDSELDDLMDVSENPASEFSTWSTLDQPKVPKSGSITDQIDVVLEDTRPERLHANLMTSIGIDGGIDKDDAGPSTTTTTKPVSLTKGPRRSANNKYGLIPPITFISRRDEKDKDTHYQKSFRVPHT